MRRRTFVFRSVPAGAAVLGAAGAAACGLGGQTQAPPSAAASPATITWLAWAGAGVNTDLHQSRIAEFGKQQPQIKIDWVQTPNLTANYEKLLTLTAGGTPPDAVQVHYTTCVDLAGRGLLAPLDKYAARDRVRREDFVPGAIDEFAWKKAQYGLPFTAALRALYYNQELFDRAGVPYPTEAWTWDDSLAKATRLTNRSTPSGVPVFGAMEQFLVLNDSPSYSITRAFGGEWFNADWTRSTVDAPATVEAIQFTADWRNRHRIVPQPGEVSGNAFNNGQAAMRIDFARGVDTLKQLNVPFRFDVVPLPRGKAGAFPCATGSGQSLVKDAKSPEAGWLLVKFLGSPDAQRLALEFDGTSRVELLEAWMPKDGMPKGFRTAFIEPLQHTSRIKAVAIPTPPRAVDLEQLYRKEFESVQAGQKTAREVATALKPQFDDILKAAGTR